MHARSGHEGRDPTLSPVEKFFGKVMTVDCKVRGDIGQDGRKGSHLQGLTAGSVLIWASIYLTHQRSPAKMRVWHGSNLSIRGHRSTGLATS